MGSEREKKQDGDNSGKECIRTRPKGEKERGKNRVMESDRASEKRHSGKE